MELTPEQKAKYEQIVEMFENAVPLEVEETELITNITERLKELDDRYHSMVNAMNSRKPAREP